MFGGKLKIKNQIPINIASWIWIIKLFRRPGIGFCFDARVVGAKIWRNILCIREFFNFSRLEWWKWRKYYFLKWKEQMKRQWFVNLYISLVNTWQIFEKRLKIIFCIQKKNRFTAGIPIKQSQRSIYSLCVFQNLIHRLFIIITH